MSRSTIFGKVSSSGETLHIDEVLKALNHSFICNGCGTTLTPVKSIARKKDWHFRHISESNLLVCRQRGLHDFAQQVLLESNSIQISRNIRINYMNPEKEVWLEKRYRSDVAVDYNGSILHFEVFVTCDLTTDKIKYYEENLIKCLKIDLSDKKYLIMPQEEIVDTILNSINNKTTYGWDSKIIIPITESASNISRWEPQMKSQPVQESFWKRYRFEIVISAILILIFFLIGRQPKRKRT